jgi:hypothetical protein
MSFTSITKQKLANPLLLLAANLPCSSWKESALIIIDFIVEKLWNDVRPTELLRRFAQFTNGHPL